MIEDILSDYRGAYGLSSICFRYFNASGADASGQIGECRDPETHFNDGPVGPGQRFRHFW